MGKRWTKEELSFLEKNADRDYEWLSNELDRSVRAIQHKISSRKLRSSEWTDQEIDLLRKNKHLSPEEFKEEFNSERSVSAISQKMRDEYGTSLKVPRVVIDEDFAWFVGALYADGHVSEYTISFNVKDEDFVEEIQRVIEKSFGMNTTIKKNEKYHRIWSSSKKYKELFPKTPNNPISLIRHIRCEYPEVLEEYVWNFLGGVYDGDGSTRISNVGGSNGYVRPSFSVKGDEEQKFFVELLNSLGYETANSEFQIEVKGERDTRLSVLEKLDIRIKRKKSKNGVYEMNSKYAKKFVAKYHYLQTLPVGKYYGYFINGELVAVAAFGNTVSDSARRGVLGKEYSDYVRELKRFCIKEGHTVKNAASMYLSKIIKQYSEDVGVWAVLTYADKDEGHDGTIYQAMSALKIGETDEEVVFEYDGRKVSSRNLVKYDLDKVSMRKSPGKIKYVIPCGTKNIRKKVREVVSNRH